MNDHTELIRPNHHADHAGFSGIKGWLIAQTMTVGRTAQADLAIDATGLEPGANLVDVGCGPGVAATRAAGMGASVIGVDPSSQMLGVARRRDRAGRVDWREGVAENLPVDDGSQDVAWSLASVHHWPDIDGGLAEVYRVLRADGTLLAMERSIKRDATGLASHGWTLEQADRFAAMSEEAGFTDSLVETRTARRGQVVLVRATKPGDAGNSPTK